MSVPLKLGSRDIVTVFDLVGDAENDLTAALGWALSQAEGFARRLMTDVFGYDTGDVLSVALQRFGPDGGYTDVEVTSQKAHLIIEAKKGWWVADKTQLASYANRPVGVDARLLSLSAADQKWALRQLDKLAGSVPVRHRSWGELSQLAEACSHQGPHASRRLLRDLSQYLKGASRMQAVSSNWAYCVVLGTGDVPGTSVDWMDIPLKHRKYFHPYGKKWPVDPPNYMAFRWQGHVRQFHHVDAVRVVDDASEALPEVIPANAVTGPHVVYDLGPPIELPSPLKNGPIYATGRVWVMIDLLFTAPTLREAMRISQERRKSVGEPPEPQ